MTHQGDNEVFGKLLAAPIRLVNTPARAVEKLLEDKNSPDDGRVLSAPLEALAEAVEEVVDGEKK